MNARPLTVGALIELLRAGPMDALIVVPGYELGWDSVHGGEVRTLELEPLGADHHSYEGNFQDPRTPESPRTIVIAIGTDRLGI